MTLSEYINSFPRSQRANIRRQMAAAMNVSNVYIRMMCNGTKSIPGKYAIPIEKITQGTVTRYEVSPTLYPYE